MASLNNGKYKHKVFPNNEQGYQQFVNWIVPLFADTKPLICMEATGAYSLPLAEFMVKLDDDVSVVNPAKIKAFANSELSRTETDKADAKLIARYAQTMQPALWTPPPENIRILQALMSLGDTTRPFAPSANVSKPIVKIANIVCAAMRKRIHLAFAILKSGQPFDPNYS